MSKKAIAIGFAASAFAHGSVSLGPIDAFGCRSSARAISKKPNEFVVAVGNSVCRTDMTDEESEVVRRVIARALGQPGFFECMQFEAERHFDRISGESTMKPN